MLCPSRPASSQRTAHHLDTGMSWTIVRMGRSNYKQTRREVWEYLESFSSAACHDTSNVWAAHEFAGNECSGCESRRPMFRLCHDPYFSALKPRDILATCVARRRRSRVSRGSTARWGLAGRPNHARSFPRFTRRSCKIRGVERQ
jgi:hypothetical protein